MPEQAPEIRRHNFSEVALGYTPAQAEAEARRCLNCKNAPCMQGCPVSVRIPAFIACIARGDYAAAYETVTATNALPAVCGRVCPQERWRALSAPSRGDRTRAGSSTPAAASWPFTVCPSWA